MKTMIAGKIRKLPSSVEEANEMKCRRRFYRQSLTAVGVAAILKREGLIIMIISIEPSAAHFYHDTKYLRITKSFDSTARLDLSGWREIWVE